MKWEYESQQITGDFVDDDILLNRLGRLGWELVTIHNDVAYFKRMYQEHLREDPSAYTPKKIKNNSFEYDCPRENKAL